jgi:transposase
VPVSREHRRAKTDRLDTEQLKRSFLGWLRGERDHCKMAAIPTFAEEDTKRPTASARPSLASTHDHQPHQVDLGTAASAASIRRSRRRERLEHLRTPEGEPIPPNTLAELSRDLERSMALPVLFLLNL